MGWCSLADFRIRAKRRCRSAGFSRLSVAGGRWGNRSTADRDRSDSRQCGGKRRLPGPDQRPGSLRCSRRPECTSRPGTQNSLRCRCSRWALRVGTGEDADRAAQVVGHHGQGRGVGRKLAGGHVGQPCGLQFGDGLLDDGVPAVIDLDQCRGQTPPRSSSPGPGSAGRTGRSDSAYCPEPGQQLRLTTSCCRTWPRTRSWTATRSGAPADRVQRETGNGPRRRRAPR